MSKLIRGLSVSFVTLSVMTLSACQTSSLTESEKAPVPASNQPFSGELKEIDKTQSVLSFVGKSNVINHEGKFTQYDAQIALDAEEPANLERARMSVVVTMASAVIDAEGLQAHLQRDDFFASDKFPTATFTSKSIVKTGDTQYAITGDLTIKGTTKTITLDAVITDEYLTAQYDLPRAEFGIGNDTYGQKLLEPLVPVDVKLVFTK